MIDSVQGSEKIVTRVRTKNSDEAWALNTKGVERNRFADSEEWVRASYLLGEILHSLFPENLPEPLGMENVVEDRPEGMRRNILRKSRFVSGEIPSKESNFSQLYQKFVTALSTVGVNTEVIDDWITNFVFDSTSGQIVYLDSIDPVCFVGADESDKSPFQPSVDVDKLSVTIRSTDLPSSKKNELLKMVTEYNQLTKQILSHQPPRRV